MAEGAPPADFEVLAARARAGDRDAYALLYQRYCGPIARIARASLLPDAVEDAVAETFVRAWAALPRYKSTGAPFAAWLYAIARHVIADVHRRAHRELPPVSGLSPSFEGHSDDRVLSPRRSRVFPPSSVA